MRVERHYALQAVDGREHLLESALNALAADIGGRSGCLRTAVLRRSGDLRHFLFVEVWSSADAYERVRRDLPRTVFDPVLAAIADPPEVEIYDQIPLSD